MPNPGLHNTFVMFPVTCDNALALPFHRNYCLLSIIMANPHENDDIDPEVCWDGAEDGIPNMSDPFIRTYLHGRDALIFQERKLRSGS